MIEATTRPILAPRSPAAIAPLQIGILTRGKATLGMVLASLILQEELAVRIQVVDTSQRPVISREDVRYALRLADDRRIECTYEFLGARNRSFSTGKAKLVRALDGPYLCLMDDDIVMPSSALTRLMSRASALDRFGFIGPTLVNSPTPSRENLPKPQYVPGSIIHQDVVVRNILLAYYESTTDVLDRQKTDQKVWETAFLTELFVELQRPSFVDLETVSFHLDYQERSSWFDEERTVISRSKLAARELVARFRTAAGVAPPLDLNHSWSRAPRSAGPRWVSRARRLLGLR